MEDLKKLYEEIDEKLEKIHKEQVELIKRSDDYLNDTAVAHNFGQMQGLLMVWSRLRKMIGE